MRIKLRNLLNLTEQAPSAPIPVPIQPGMNADGQDYQRTPPATPDTSPEPEDPGEYDFTKDFRAFEDKKNKAETEAKKVLLNKMNERLLNKTIVANASRGYGQPKTDYTIKAVKKVSVEFWYKDYVVIVSDENDKKYFLTPGINIKIESEGEGEGGGSEPAPGGEQPPVPGQEQPQADQDASANEPGAQETPNGTPPPAPEPEGEPQGVTPQTPDANPTPAPATQAAAPTPEQPEEPQPASVPPRKKKKVAPVAEWVQNDLNSFLLEFMSDDVKNQDGKVNFVTYIQEASKMLAEGVNATKVRVKLLIPESHMVNVDGRDIKLAALDAMRQRTYGGQYSKGSVEVNKTGRYYLLEYIKEIGYSI
jgi:hypothetical protein